MTRQPGEELTSRTRALLDSPAAEPEAAGLQCAAADVVCVCVLGRERPLYLKFSFCKTTDLTDHSVALVPKHEAHAAITVTFTDVTEAQVATALVRRRYTISYNDKLDDAEVAALLV